MLFNGEIWRRAGVELGRVYDTEVVFGMLVDAEGREGEVVGSLEGDFAIVFVRGGVVHVFKDYFGKKSLLLGFT
jgi:asparagine synthetase B (glutamine-hydrolysing)